jgi:hypothetical protein
VDTRAAGSTVDGSYQRGGRIRSGVFQVTGRGGYTPDTRIVSLRVSAVNPAANGNLVIYPCGALPTASTMSFAAGRTTTQSAITMLDARGRICVRSSVATDLVVAATGGVQAQAFTAVRPARLLDANAGRLDAGLGVATAVTIAGRAGLPTAAKLAWLNITTTASPAPGSLYAWPCGTVRPRVPLLTFQAGVAASRGTWMPLGASGELCLASTSATRAIVDTTGAMTQPSALRVDTYRPKVMVDTRTNGSTDDHLFQRQGSLTPKVVQRYRLAGRTGVAAGPYAVSISVTASGPAAAGSLSVFPCGTTAPTVPTVSYAAGVSATASATLQLSATDEVCVVSSARTHLLITVDQRYGTGGAFG